MTSQEDRKIALVLFTIGALCFAGVAIFLSNPAALAFLSGQPAHKLTVIFTGDLACVGEGQAQLLLDAPQNAIPLPNSGESIFGISKKDAFWQLQLYDATNKPTPIYGDKGTYGCISTGGQTLVWTQDAYIKPGDYTYRLQWASQTFQFGQPVQTKTGTVTVMQNG